MEWWHEWSLCHSERPATVLRVWLPLPPWLDRGVVALQAPLSSSTVQSFRWARTKGQWDLLVILYSPSAEHVQSVKEIYWSYCTVLLLNTYKVSRSTGHTAQSFCWTRTKCQGDLLVTLYSPSAEHVQSVKEIYWSHCTVLLLNTYKVSRRSAGHTVQSFCWTRTKCQGDLLVTLHSPSAEHVQSVKEIGWPYCTVLLLNTYKVSRRSAGHTVQSFCWTRTKCQGDRLAILYSPSAEHVQSVKEIGWPYCTVLLLNTYKVSRRSTGHTAQSFCWTRTKCQGDLLVMMGFCCCCCLCFVVVVVVVVFCFLFLFFVVFFFACLFVFVLFVVFFLGGCVFFLISGTQLPFHPFWMREYTWGWHVTTCRIAKL